MTQPFLAQVEIFSFNFAPKGWAQCNGQLLPINQNQALFSLLGTTYGGDGRVNFGLPDLRSRVPIHQGAGFTLGERAGEENHTLISSEMPQHNHFPMGDTTTGNTDTPASSTALGKGTNSGLQSPSTQFSISIYSSAPPTTVLAPQSIGYAGGSQAHPNLMPYLCLNMCIALVGIFPSQN
ncbi:MAG TPA: tail fiber protein [Rhizomicrobium sp.]|jgi:microcystin-dependent protein|nr:tail fiber protein [Rhizomicrobium sp.]